MVSDVEAVAWARDLAGWLLRPLGRRWQHVQAGGGLAASIAPAFGEQGPALVAAAYLHDIGYAPQLALTGFHPLDGARHLRTQGYETLARLVAHHSGARVEGRLRHLDGFEDEFPFLDSPLEQALTYCDLTTGPDGRRVTLEDRLAEIMDRYGPEHTVSRAMSQCRAELERACSDTQRRLARAGLC
jgi:hypothetical protein